MRLSRHRGLPGLRVVLVAAALTLSSLGASSAQVPSTADSGLPLGFRVADSAGCKVWDPPQLKPSDFIPRYAGACKGGLAEGPGKLQWLYRYADLKVQSTWEGYFHQGVYVGARAYPNSIVTEANSNEYIVSLGETPSGDVVAFASNNREGIMDLCASSIIGISTGKSLTPADDNAVKQAMVAAGSSLRALCPNSNHSVQVNVYATPFSIDANGNRTAAVADAHIDMQTNAISSYSNEASNLARSKARLTAMNARTAAAQQVFADFSKRNGVTAWVTVTQLDQNPFRYEGKVVGVVVGLDRMATRDTAIVDGAMEDDGARVQLRGVTPDFPGPSHGVLLAALIGKREPLPGESASDGQLTVITRIDSRTCVDADCEDLLSWARGPNRIDWGAPYLAPASAAK